MFTHYCGIQSVNHSRLKMKQSDLNYVCVYQIEVDLLQI